MLFCSVCLTFLLLFLSEKKMYRGSVKTVNAHAGMMEMWPSRCVALAKRSLQYMLPFGLAATLTGTVFVDRGNRERALGTMGDTAVTIRQNKVSYCILSYIINTAKLSVGQNCAGKEKEVVASRQTQEQTKNIKQLIITN